MKYSVFFIILLLRSATINAMSFSKQEQQQLCEYFSHKKEKNMLVSTLDDPTIQTTYKKINITNVSQPGELYMDPSLITLNDEIMTSPMFPYIRTLITDAIIYVKTKPLQLALQDSHRSYLAQLPSELLLKIVNIKISDQKIAKIYAYFLSYLKEEIEIIKKNENEKELMSSWYGIPAQHII